MTQMEGQAALRSSASSERITPEQFPLAKLTQAQLDAIVSRVPGGAGNVQDIYPLAPAQEGILFHHLMSRQGDVYVTRKLFAFGKRRNLDEFLDALQAVIERHDILRTAIVWEGLDDPVQVVWRQAPLAVEEVHPAQEDVSAELMTLFDPLRYCFDPRSAPLLRVFIARDPSNDRWLLLLLRHYLALDDIAFGVLLDEIEWHLQGQQPTLSPPRPYRNFVIQTRSSAGAASHEAFFRQMLTGIDEPTLPFELSHVQANGTEGISEARHLLDEPLASRVREQATALNISPASVFHLAWAQVLARASGRERVVFGTVLSGRTQGWTSSPHRELGLFSNTLPICININERGVRRSTRDTHDLLTELLTHQYAPLALAQRCSEVAAPHPLFSALLNYRHTRKLETLGAQVQERTHYPLTLTVDDLGTRFSLITQVNAGVDPQRVGEMMCTALDELVGALAREPERAICRIDVLPPAERHRVLIEWNATATQYPANLYVHELFERQVELTPHELAVISEDETLTYAGLNARANQLARHLRARGVGPDTLVGICVERSVELVVGLLGILKAGGAYVPLDPKYPAGRLRYMIEAASPVVVLTQEHLKGSALSASTAALTALDSDWSEIAGYEPTNLDRDGLNADQRAYVIYTSGSTGTPKAAQVQHRGLQNLLAWYVDDVGLTAKDSVLLVTSQSFDLTQKNILGPLIAGGRLVLAQEPFNPASILDQIARERITLINLAPSAFSALIDADDTGELSRLQRVVLGGEPINIAKLRMLREPRPQFINSYGPTECSDVVAYHILDADLTRYENRSVPLGKPVRNTRLYVLDAHQQPLPIAVAGEICIGGLAVGGGYLNRPDLTDERFLPDPFASDEDARLYRTGDLGRWNSDGTMEFLGRNDHQVKIRGFRIELGEIESQLCAHEQVKEAVVIAREETPGEKRLVAYVTSPSKVVSVEELRRHLQARVPEYMVPAAIVTLDSFPLNPNGKLDRARLPAPDGKAYERGTYEAPQNELEAALAAIWQDVLKIDRVGRCDTFFDLGGDSLSAIRVTSRVRQLLLRELPLAEIFQHPSLHALAESISKPQTGSLASIPHASRSAPLPLSAAQQRMWFLCQIKGVNASYNIAYGLRLSGKLDISALRVALNRIVARHEALRTTFKTVQGEAVQIIAPPESGLNIAMMDLEGHTDAEGELRHITAREANHPFDLEQGPLCRGRLIRLGAAEHVLLLTIHHTVSDGWSMTVLFNELSALYDAFAQGRADPLPPLGFQYADYAVWQRQWLTGQRRQAQLDYWKRTLKAAPALLNLPTDHPRPPVQSYEGGEVTITLCSDLTQRLKNLSQRHGTTLFMTLMAGWAAALSRLSGQDDLVIGTPSANRTRTDIEGLIGLFVNTLALRFDVSGSPTVAELLHQVKDRMLAAQSHAEIGFEEVVELVKPVRSTAHSPIFQVLMAWQNMPPGSVELPGLKLATMTTPYVTSKFDLALSVAEVEQTVTGAAIYASALFEGPTVRRYVEYWRATLDAMAENDQQRIDFLPSFAHRDPNRSGTPNPEPGEYKRADYEPPQGDIELALAEIWTTLLGVERVGRHDNFFALGGTSLLLLLLLNKVTETYGITLKVELLYSAESLAGLARDIAAAVSPVTSA
ncbi:MAG TPA: amino acid adenylation domain-containing protein [Steroidobacteraceae bacterium]